jgi:hypothetical protein
VTDVTFCWERVTPGTASIASPRHPLPVKRHPMQRFAMMRNDNAKRDAHTLSAGSGDDLIEAALDDVSGGIVVTKPVDAASTGLFRLSLLGEGKKVKIS